MPYSLVNRPSLALSLLKSYLKTEGVSTKVLYANLLFAEDVGFDVYRVVEESSPHDLLGEWTFSQSAFGIGRGDPEAYLQHVEPGFEDPHVRVLRRAHPELDLKDLFLRVRERAVEFVDRLANQLLEYSPRIVGCSSMFQQQVASLALLRKVRELDPDVITMIGGANCEGPMGRATLELFPWVDFVASGEADAYIGSFCRRLLDEGPPTRAEDLPYGMLGRCKRLRQGAYVPLGTGRQNILCSKDATSQSGTEQAPRAVVQNLDDTDIPIFDEYFEAFSELSFADYVTPTLPIETSRGCWWGQVHHCTFCGLNDIGMAFRSKSPDRVISEMRYLSQRYGVRRFETADEILDMSFLKNVLPRLAEEEPYTIFYEVKSNLKREHLEILSKAGVREVQPGIESLHDAVLDHFDKGNNGLMNIQFLKWAGELGIRVGWNFLFGAPGESDEWYEEIAERVPLLHHLQPPGGSSKIGFHRFSPYHFDAERFGLHLTPRRAYAHVYPLSVEDLEGLAYYFEDRSASVSGRIGPEPPRVERPGLEAAWLEIKRWRRSYFDSQGSTPELVFEPAGGGVDGGGVVIRDTRPGATAGRHLLDDQQATVLYLCRKITNEAALMRGLEVEFDGPEVASPVELKSVLKELLEKKLVMRDGERYLSLVLEQVRPLPAHAESASGEIRIVDFTRDWAEHSMARESVRQPQQVSVRELFAAP